jgi:hypothetical protein
MKLVIFVVAVPCSPQGGWIIKASIGSNLLIPFDTARKKKTFSLKMGVRIHRQLAARLLVPTVIKLGNPAFSL